MHPVVRRPHLLPCEEASNRDVQPAKRDMIPQALGAIGIGVLILLVVCRFGRATGHWMVNLGLLGLFVVIAGCLELPGRLWDVITGRNPRR